MNLPNANSVDIKCDGVEFKNYRVIDASKISINTDINQHNFEIRTGYFLSKEKKYDLSKKLKLSDKSQIKKSDNLKATSSRLVLPTSKNLCGCC